MGLYERCVVSVIEYLQGQMRPKARRGIFTAQVVIWLMMRQRLQPGGTLASGVESLITGDADRLLSGCKRAREKRFSHRTGGYSHARQRLPQLLCRQVLDELIARLREILHPDNAHVAYVVDGSTLELEASPALCRLYPPALNQHGRAHWPVLNMVVMHEAETGLAEAPHWGAMYGAGAVSEQQLAEQAMAALRAGSILIGDRNFGVFTIAWAARQHGLDVVIRMTNDRANKVAGGPIAREGEQEICWKPSPFDGRRRGGMPSGASLSGRLISLRIGRGKSKEWLHLFTTLALPSEQVLALYGKRWNIETDLRSLKRTVNLHHVAARNESMMGKELLVAIAAYNLVRAVMALAAHRHHLSPRQLSFSFVLNVVNARWSRLQGITDAEEYRRAVHEMIDAAAQGKHPNRRKHRTFPRAVWGRRGLFPSRKENTLEAN